MSLYDEVSRREHALAREEYLNNKEKILADILILFKSDTLNKSEITLTLIKYLPVTLDYAIQELIESGKICILKDKNKGDRGIIYKIINQYEQPKK